MIGNAIIQIKPEELKRIILDYYKNLYNEDNITVQIEPRKENRGYRDEEVLVTKIKVKKQQKIGNCNINIEEELEDKDIEQILKYFLQDILKEKDYEIGYINLDTKIELVGFYETKEPRFYGVNISLKRLEKKQKLKCE